MDISS